MRTLGSVIKGDDKSRAFVDLALDVDLTAHAGNVAMDQIESHTFAVLMTMKRLIDSKKPVSNVFKIKTQTVIGNDQTRLPF